MKKRNKLMMYKVRNKQTNLYQTNFHNQKIDSEKFDIRNEELKHRLNEQYFDDWKLK